MADDVLTEIVPPEDLKQFERVYYERLQRNDMTHTIQFEYAWCLVRSKYSGDIRKGIILLEDLCRSNEEGKRDYLYYLAIGNARVKEYNKALEYIKDFLNIEPGNTQVATLERCIRKRMDKEAYKGMAVASGILVGIGAVVGLGIALSKK